MVTVALVAYVAATAVGMVVGSLVPFWLSVAPTFFVAATIRTFFAPRNPFANERLGCALVGCVWGALAGSFATSTCVNVHGTLLGSEAAALAVVCWAMILCIVAHRLPVAIGRHPHALCGLLFLATVGLTLALGAEVPT
jgi:hypothetical protein